MRYSVHDGVSPIISILMLMVITLIIAGCIVFIVSKFMEMDMDSGETWLFQTDVRASSDTVEVFLTKGSINTSRMVVRLDNIVLNHSYERIGPGEPFAILAGTDIWTGQTYRVVIIVDDKVMYDNEVIAKD